MPPAPAAHDIRRDHTLATIAGHALPKRLFAFMLDERRLPHALLLMGPREIGKVSTAWALAKEILWSGLRGVRDGDEGEARRLRLHSRISRENVHPDVFTFERSGARGQIQIDTVREFEDAHAHVGPVEGAYKVLVIEDAHAMNEQAANCFLKLLEEPPAHLKFLLTSDAPTELLPTIRSRCAPVPFHPLTEEELLAWLGAQTAGRAAGKDRATLQRVARLAEGRPGRALALLETEEEAAPLADALLAVEREGFARIFRAGSDIARHTAALRDPGEAFGRLLACYRDALLCALASDGGESKKAGTTESLDRSTGDALLHHPELRERMSELAKRGPAALMRAIDALVEEIQSGRMVFQRELHVEAVLSRLGMAMKAGG